MDTNLSKFVLYKLSGANMVAPCYLLSPQPIYERVDVKLFSSHPSLYDVTFCRLYEGTITACYNHAQQQHIKLTPYSERHSMLSCLCTTNINELAHVITCGLEGKALLFEEVINGVIRSDDCNNNKVYKNNNAVVKSENKQQLTDNVKEALQLLYLQGFFDWRPSYQRTYSSKWTVSSFSRIFFSNASMVCERCGQRQFILSECSICDSSHCYYCASCLNLGRVKSCQPLLVWNNIKVKKNDCYQIPTLGGESQLNSYSEARLTNSFGQHSKFKEANKMFSDSEAKVAFDWQGTLSEQQKIASEKLLNFVEDSLCQQQSSKQGNDTPCHEFLIWAVCGAGKTEILFKSIHRCLQKREKVLITSPRRDVINELGPRLQIVFPQTTIRTLHGESHEKFLNGDLYVATTHQLLRFYHYFDLIVIDEEDAFPFHHDRMLPYAVNRALKKTGKKVYLTATPKQGMIDRVKRQQLPAVQITKRFHGHPLAVPCIKSVGDWRKHMQAGTLLSPLIDYVNHLIKYKRHGYLFVPQVSDLELVHSYLEERLYPYVVKTMKNQQLRGKPVSNLRNKVDALSPVEQPFVITTVHAQSDKRTSIVQRFRQRAINLLITTTILERGVTIPYCDVGVLGSDESVFDTSALIQMAGRTGRKLEDPIGNVWFFPEARTRQQKRAIDQIKQWNKQK